MTQEDRDAELDIIEFSPEYHEDRLKDFLVKNEDDWLWEHEDGGYSEDEDIQWEYFCPEGKRRPETVWDKSAGREVINEEDKLLVFTTGQRTMAPHQIGVKLMSKIKFKRKLNIPQVNRRSQHDNK